MYASASCLARREHTRRPVSPQAAMLGAGKRGAKSKAQQHQKRHFPYPCAVVPPPLAGGGVGGGVRSRNAHFQNRIPPARE
jgi:hypothetical protein